MCCSVLSALKLDEPIKKVLLMKLEKHGRTVPESKAKEVGRVLICMKDR
jgi:protein SEY1